MQLVAEVELVPRSESTRSVRSRVHQALAGVEPDRRRDAELVASELVTNAVVHAGGGMIRFRAWLQSGRCRFEVSDCANAWPERRDLDVDSSGGRGLQLVQALSTAWGAFGDPVEGKTVWCELALGHGESTG